MELDVWNGTTRTPSSLMDILLALQSHLEMLSWLLMNTASSTAHPIILSIEQHCNLEQQRVQVDIMKAIFKNRLATRIDNPDAPGTVLPSPNELKYKILLKGKRLDSTDEGGDDDDDDDNDEDAEVAAAKAAAKR